MTFFTRLDRKHTGKPLAHWLVEAARALGIGGATTVSGSEGFGHHRRIHSSHFIELADQPVEVIMAVTADESERLFAKLHAENVAVFYARTQIEFGVTGEEEPIMKSSPPKSGPVTGYQLTFFTQNDHRHHGKPLGHWLVEEARAMGIGGATLIAGSEGFGHHRRLHSAHLIDLSEQPVEVVMAVTEDEAERFFAKLQAEGVKVFYSRTPVEFGTTGAER